MINRRMSRIFICWFPRFPQSNFKSTPSTVYTNFLINASWTFKAIANFGNRLRFWPRNHKVHMYRRIIKLQVCLYLNNLMTFLYIYSNYNIFLHHEHPYPSYYLNLTKFLLSPSILIWDHFHPWQKIISLNYFMTIDF